MIGRYDHLRVLFTVRSHYRPQVIPDELDLPVVVHRGFEGAEFEAVMEYADYYGLEPPTAPPVHGEFDNPLFLRLLCEALKSEGRLSLDQASMGISELRRINDRRYVIPGGDPLCRGIGLVAPRIPVSVHLVRERHEERVPPGLHRRS